MTGPSDSGVQVEALRAEFEADGEPMGFDLTRQSVAAVEPWSEYVSEATGHRWAGWQAARALPVAALSDADRELMETDAHRYRWLRKGYAYTVDVPLPSGKKVSYIVAPRQEAKYAESLDASIDAVRTRPAEGNNDDN